MPPTLKPRPSNQATDGERLAYVADVAADLRTLIHESRFRTISYLLDIARLEAERTVKNLPNAPAPPPPTP